MKITKANLDYHFGSIDTDEFTTKFDSSKVHTFDDSDTQFATYEMQYNKADYNGQDEDVQYLDNFSQALSDLSPIEYNSLEDFINQIALRIIIQYKVRPSDIRSEINTLLIDYEENPDTPNIFMSFSTNLDGTMCVNDTYCDDNYSKKTIGLFIVLPELND